MAWSDSVVPIYVSVIKADIFVSNLIRHVALLTTHPASHLARRAPVASVRSWKGGTQFRRAIRSSATSRARVVLARMSDWPRLPSRSSISDVTPVRTSGRTPSGVKCTGAVCCRMHPNRSRRHSLHPEQIAARPEALACCVWCAAERPPGFGRAVARASASARQPLPLRRATCDGALRPRQTMHMV